MQVFTDFIAAKLGTRNWRVAPRMTERLRSIGCDRAVHQSTYRKIHDEWETQTYGATIKNIEAAAPDLFRALKLLVDGHAPEGLYPHYAPAELLRRIEAGDIAPHSQRAAQVAIEARTRA